MKTGIPTKHQRLRWKIQGAFIPDGPHGDRKRGKILEKHLARCGKNFKVASQAFIYDPSNLCVGDDVYVGFGSYLGRGPIDLGDEVLLGNFVTIVASNHLKEDESYRFGGFEESPVQIGRGTWVGAGAVVTAGTKIGKGCLIAAGSVVTKDIADYSEVGGVPAKPIRRSDERKPGGAAHT